MGSRDLVSVSRRVSRPVLLESRSRRSQVSSRSRRISVSVSSSSSRDFAQVIFYEVLLGVPQKTVLKNDCSKFIRSKRSVAKLSLLLCCL